MSDLIDLTSLRILRDLPATRSELIETIDTVTDAIHRLQLTCLMERADIENEMWDLRKRVEKLEADEFKRKYFIKNYRYTPHRYTF